MAAYNITFQYSENVYCSNIALGTEAQEGNKMNKIIEYLRNNEETFNDLIEELDNYNGYLGDDRYYDMEELDELYSGVNASEVLTRAFYGHDDETFELDSEGNKDFSRSTFNPNRNYFYYNGYGNLVSSDFKDYSYRLDEYFIKDMIDNQCYLDIPYDLQELIDKYEASEEK